MELSLLCITWTELCLSFLTSVTFTAF